MAGQEMYASRCGFHLAETHLYTVTLQRTPLCGDLSNRRELSPRFQEFGCRRGGERTRLARARFDDDN